MNEFPPNSRYRDVPLRTRTAPDGTQQGFVGRRIIPPTERYRALERIRTDGESRIDRIAASAYGDPEQYWRICDANGDAEPGSATASEGRLMIVPVPLEMTQDGDA